ncbi:hypothetical protein LTR36_004729 [Oleoguttula mirabilis]|uniref:RRM domain-containing protein n=1 Tax=Oleoguttula mirabilis TaxID=1507867 RepID=A0AAV9JG07_9PEZI|nr:hypothetical protein LTR36_004729 [Oleoguttula mirabilis]
MASSLASLVRPTANRAVHLRITPRPSNIGESREIMRLISQFGEVEHFKNMKYDALSAPNTTIVIFKDEDAAQSCLKRSPIRFRMGKAPPPTTSTATPGFNTSSSSPSQSTPNANAPDEARIFHIQTNAARAHFRDQLNMAHYHGHFAVDGKSAAQQDLATRVPILGLSDVNWRAEDKPWKVTRMERERDGAYRGSGRRRGLMEMWAEGQKVVPGVGSVRRGGGV